ncbi:MAG: formylglycine-generating enzyme family protein [Synechococcales cyanobacterium RU_4_20]|nr:formylglycine-generating enzyme family protein [Synechococcales cyanobacterium RU_4_20]NJR70584.1 formylglycine-generating enzyme family protein [Synechococcales cyanobacterium CRU_2_2]
MAELTIKRSIRTAQYFTEDLGNGVGLDMVLIPGGRFLMGSPKDEPERWGTEGPQHEVTVPSFFMGRYPVTQAQWKAIAQKRKSNRKLELDPSGFNGADRPVENIEWDDIVEFCARLSRETGREYRLPSEAEWEYACRAGTTTPFHFGEMITTELANYDGSGYNGGPEGKSRQETTPVGSFPANGFGLCDMHGNVWEWCADHWHENYEGAPADGSAWLENQSKLHIQRGGSWLNFPRLCRSASRNGDNLAFRHDFYGFRVLCVLPRTP